MNLKERLQVLCAAFLPEEIAKKKIFKLCGKWNGAKKSNAKKIACRENAKKPRPRFSKTFADDEKQLDLF
jgi:hypothetical protein